MEELEFKLNRAIDFKRNKLIFIGVKLGNQNILGLQVAVNMIDKNKKIGIFTSNVPNINFGNTFYVQDILDMSLLEIEKKCQEWKEKHNVEYMIINYLQLIKDKDILSRLKKITEELDINIIILKDMNYINKKKPTLIDVNRDECTNTNMVFIIYQDEEQNVNVSNLYEHICEF